MAIAVVSEGAAGPRDSEGQGETEVILVSIHDFP